MKAKLANLFVKSIQINSILQKRALEELHTRRVSDSAATEKTAALVDHMVEKGCVAEHQKQSASELLTSHSGTMDLLWNSVEKLAEAHEGLEKAGRDMGQAIDPAQSGVQAVSSYTSLDDPYVGRRTSEKKASDAAIWAVVDGSAF
jgi:hypothetical protein